jgi:hypothetical protein
MQQDLINAPAAQPASGISTIERATGDIAD